MKLSLSPLGLAAIALAGPIQDRQEEEAVRVVLQVSFVTSPFVLEAGSPTWSLCVPTE